MKRILSRKSLICLCCVSVFFTGCNKGTVSTQYEIPSYEAVAPPESRGRERETRELLATKDSSDKLEKENEKLISDRFDKVTGKPAFWLPPEHSAQKEDFIFFQVLDMTDGYFYYFYVTRSLETGEEVHALVKNNYKNEGDHMVLHETASPWKTVRETASAGKIETEVDIRERPPFYAQMYQDSKGKQMISLYEDGDLYVLGTDGTYYFKRTAENSAENMLGLMEWIFRVKGDRPDYYEMDVTNVTTDGSYGFYIPVSLSKGNYEDQDNFLFFYSFTPIDAENEFLRQFNLNYSRQVEYWERLADQATEERDPEADWEETLREIPYKWGPYSMYAGLNEKNPISIGSLLKWKPEDVRRFVKNDLGLPSSKYDKDYTEMVYNLDKKLDRYFFADEKNGYCSLVGSTDSVNTDQEMISRTYEVTTGEGDNEKTVSYTDTVKVNVSKTALLSEETAIDRFEVMENRIGFGMTEGSIAGSDEYTIGMYKDFLYLLLTPGASENQIKAGSFPAIWDDQTESGYVNLDIQLLNRADGDDWLMASDTEHNRIFLNNSQSGVIVLMESDLNPKGYQNSKEDEGLTRKMNDLAKKDSRTEYDFSKMDIHTNADRYGRANVIALGGGEFLFTTFYNGMQLYKPDGTGSSDLEHSTPGTITRISDWPLYQAWLEADGKVVAVGFDRTDATYFSMDIVKARVYTFDLKADGAKAGYYAIPFADGGGPAGIDRKPSESQEVPDYMKDSWEKAKAIREASPSSAAGSETVPDETIYETSEDMGKIWESRASESKAAEKEKGEDQNDGE